MPVRKRGAVWAFAYTDCNPQQDNDRRRGRHLNEDEESPCARSLLWAAARVAGDGCRWL